MQSDKVFIFDSSDVPYSENGIIVLWRSFLIDNPLNTISIPKLIEDKAEHLRSQYLAWVYNLGQFRINGRNIIDHFGFRDDFSYWWTSLIVEKCHDAKSSQITDAIRMLAFVDWASDRSIRCVKLTSPNRSLANCFRVWCNRTGIEFEWQSLSAVKIYNSPSRQIYSMLPRPLRVVIWLCKYIKDRLPLISCSSKIWNQSKGNITFISYLFNLMPDAVVSGQFKSQYWGCLPEELIRAGYRINWLHLHVADDSIPDSRSAAAALNVFNNVGGGKEIHATLDSFLCARVVWCALRDWFILMFKGLWLSLLMRPVDDANVDLWPLFVDDWKESSCGVVALRNALTRSLFAEALVALPESQIGCYLQENQGWEFALIQTWKFANKGRLIGIPHTLVRFWDLRYFFDPRSYKRSDKRPMPLPDQVAVNGKASADAYLLGGYPKDQIIQVEALRYMYMSTANRQIKPEPIGACNQLRLLVIGDYLESNTLLQMHLLSRAATLLPREIAITVKPHPACPIRTDDYPELHMKLAIEPLSNLLQKCDVAYSSSFTTAAVDAFCAGVPIISVLDPAVLNMSPLRGYKCVKYVSTHIELASVLCSSTQTAISTNLPSEFFNLDNNLPGYRQLFNIN